ncbi:InlB B-repeat-containing protein, partial [uncultured Treponema sp.]|uniref:InlB B-repeat-containing protein n=1 Tax=uncultured Treponema sp. TaxID=162155 RepID=UPI0025D2BB0B
ATKTEPIAKLAHTHKYATAWSSDETNHWHAATCEHTDQRADLAAHTWDSGVVTRESTEELEGERKYTCTICNATKTEPIAKLAHTHKYATTWSSDETNHWHAATCEHTDQKADLATHSWNSGVITKIATEESEGEKTYNCIYCGETRTEVISKLAHTHKFSTAWTTDDLNHWHAATCEHSDQKANLGNHIWGTGVKTKTESKNITTYTCTICGKEKVEEETRLFSVYFFKRIPKKDGTYDVVETTSQQVEYGTKISLPNLEVAGYTFEGWYEYGDWNYTNGQITNTEIEIKSSVGYISKFSITKYAIIYNNLLDGINNSANPATYDIFTEVTLKNPSRTGYSFSNWYTDENFVDKKTVIPEGSINNVVLYAKWVPKTYNITYKLDGGTNNKNNPTSVTFDNPKILENPTKQGFEFEGWFFDSSYTNPVTQIPVASMNSTTIYAKWIDMRPKYKVTFNSNGGSSVLAQTVRDGDCASEPSAPKKTGYFFDGWVTENGGSLKYNFSEAITENITLYASWSTSITCGSGNLNTILGNVGSGTVTVKLTAVNYSTLKTALNNNKSVYVKLDLSDCTTPIPTKAFYCCTNLKTVIMPKEISSEYSNSANYIPDYAFYGCTGLTSIDMSKCNNYIGYQSFYDCSSLQMVSIPSAITTIKDSAFYGCSKLNSVTFGKKSGWSARHIRLNEVVDMSSYDASSLATCLRGEAVNGRYSKDWEWSNY